MMPNIRVSPIWLLDGVFHIQNPAVRSVSVFCVNAPYCDGRASEGQAEQHQQGDDFMVGVDVGQAQAAVMAVKARLHRLEDVRPLQEVQTDHRRHQDWQLYREEGTRVQSQTAEASADCQ